MTAFRPCNGCTQRKDCDIKKGIAKAMKGLPIASARIRCDLPFTKYFPAGKRVSVTVWDNRNWNHDGDGIVPTQAKGTVVGPSSKKPGKLLVHLDEKVMLDDEKSIEFRAAYPKDAIVLDEPPRDACDICKRAYVHNKCSCPPEKEQ